MVQKSQRRSGQSCVWDEQSRWPLVSLASFFGSISFPEKLVFGEPESSEYKDIESKLHKLGEVSVADIKAVRSKREDEIKEYRKTVSFADDEGIDAAENFLHPPEERSRRLLRILVQLRCSEFSSTGFPVPRLSPGDLCWLCDEVQGILIKQGPLVCLDDSRINVVGDIQGDFNALNAIFETAGRPELNNFLFLGNCVGSGAMNLRTILTLFTYKCLYPKRFFMLRGNNEISDVEKAPNFRYEVRWTYGQRLDETVWERFQDVFTYLPIAATRGKSILFIHSGLSDDMLSSPPGFEGLQTYFGSFGRGPEANVTLDKIGQMTSILKANPCRGLLEDSSSNSFSKETFDRVLRHWKLEKVVRGHQCIDDGFSWRWNGRLLTLFSTPSFCNRYRNQGAIATFKKGGGVDYITEIVDKDRGTVTEVEDVVLSAGEKPILSSYGFVEPTL